MVGWIITIGIIVLSAPIVWRGKKDEYDCITLAIRIIWACAALAAIAVYAGIYLRQV